MKHLVSGLVGFMLTVVISLPFQNVIKPRDAKAFAAAMKNKIEGKIEMNAELDVRVQPIVILEDKKDEPRIKFFPQYPKEAAAQNIEGYVTLSFQVKKDGAVQGIKVTESSPPQIFDEAAIVALRKWSFSANPHQVVPNARRIRFNFSLGHGVAVDQQLSDAGL